MTAPIDLQAQCQLGQEQLMRMDYLAAEDTLAAVEEIAWARRDFDTLSRLYMPLQEARRQRRQRCGEGEIRFDFIAKSEKDTLNPRQIVETINGGQILVAGWGSIAPAMEIRTLAHDRRLFLETFLAAVYPMGNGQAIVIAPTPDVSLPAVDNVRSIDDLLRKLPAHCIVIDPKDFPPNTPRGTPETYARVMDLWEHLHAPFLAAADMQVDPIGKIEGYRRTIRVDYACELAHQKLSDVARNLLRQNRSVTTQMR